MSSDSYGDIFTIVAGFSNGALDAVEKGLQVVDGAAACCADCSTATSERMRDRLALRDSPPGTGGSTSSSLLARNAPFTPALNALQYRSMGEQLKE